MNTCISTSNSQYILCYHENNKLSKVYLNYFVSGIHNWTLTEPPYESKLSKCVFIQQERKGQLPYEVSYFRMTMISGKGIHPMDGNIYSPYCAIRSAMLIVSEVRRLNDGEISSIIYLKPIQVNCIKIESQIT